MFFSGKKSLPLWFYLPKNAPFLCKMYIIRPIVADICRKK